MAIPTQITFRGLDSSDWISANIQEHADRLERFHHGIINCRVAIDAPNHKHHKGHLYKVTINIEIPGNDIAVSHESPQDHAHENITVAIRDAFAAATRRLEDMVRERRRDVKTHEVEPHGRVTRLIAEEGYGFIETASGDEVYFHSNSVANKQFDKLTLGSEVRFVPELGDKGLQATVVKPIGKHHPVP